MALLTALLYSVTSNQTNYCFPRYNAVTITDNKMRRYLRKLRSLSAIGPAQFFSLVCVCSGVEQDT